MPLPCGEFEIFDHERRAKQFHTLCEKILRLDTTYFANIAKYQNYLFFAELEVCLSSLLNRGVRAVGYGPWGTGCGVRVVGYGLWGAGYGIRAVG